MEETVAAFQYYVEGVGILAVGSVGVVINIFALYILFRKQVSFISKNIASNMYVCIAVLLWHTIQISLLLWKLKAEKIYRIWLLCKYHCVHTHLFLAFYLLSLALAFLRVFTAFPIVMWLLTCGPLHLLCFWLLAHLTCDLS